ncbi:MAG: class I SAM-dependent methyltransferase [Deltaproteobacteria bacterium]|nr:class I SAM-dependent methyltransferase [Deltaproteobacteria bacterium]
MQCRICGSKTDPVFRAPVLSKYEIDYYECRLCGFLQTEDPFWLDEAYEYPVSPYDTGYVARNISLANKLTALLWLFCRPDGRFVDFAGGCGIFVRLMRDIGFDFYWYDKYAKNVFAKGFEWDFSSRAEAVTCFEAFEHFVEPLQELRKMLDVSENIFFTTELLPNPVPKPGEWWYYGLEHGQHISFYSDKTLKFLAAKYRLNYTRVGSLHIFSPKRFNGLLLKFLQLTQFKIHHLIRFMLRSKTWDDHIFQVEKLKKQNEDCI